jgi:hypothetical protein
MAKNYLYINIGGKAKKIGKYYYNDDGTARKVSKAYIRDENGNAVLAYVAHIHDYTWQISYTYDDSTNHITYNNCSCGDYEESLEPHNFVTYKNGNYTWWSAGSSGCYQKQYCTTCDSAKNHVISGSTSGHVGGSATCKSKKTCSCCGAKYGNYASHTGGTATCKKKAICKWCDQEYGSLADHSYSGASCLSASKCSVCGAIEPGSVALGHNWGGWLGASIAGQPCYEEHRTCTRCGKEETRKLHSGRTSVSTTATCTQAGTKTTSCADCGAVLSSTAQSALNHTGGTATCTEKAICTRCNQPYGSALGHQVTSDWHGNNAIYKCTRCGKSSTKPF